MTFMAFRPIGFAVQQPYAEKCDYKTMKKGKAFKTGAMNAKNFN